MTSPQPGYQAPAPPLRPPPGPPTGEPWTRSSADRVIAGVCGGLGRRLGVDPVILRVVVVVLAFFAGAGIVLYAAAWLFMPLDRTNRSVLSDAFGSTTTDRTRSVLTAAALLAVLAIAAATALDGGFVPGVLIVLVGVAVLMVVRRDEHAVGRPPYQSAGGYPAPPYGAPGYGDAQYVQPQYGPAPTGTTTWGAPSAPVAATDPSVHPSTTADPSTEPTAVTGTDPSTEPTTVLGADAYGSAEPTVTMPYPRASDIPSPSVASAWQPPYYQPPPPPYMPEVPPPMPPRERSYLGVLTVSAMIAVLGVMGIVDASGVAVPLAAYLVAALGVVGAGLVLGAWMGRSRGLIALGIVLGLAIGPAVLVDAVAGTEWRDWSNADNIRLAPTTPGELAESYDYGGGSLRMDLTGLDFEGDDLATRIDMGAGEVIVIVPADTDVVVDGAVVMGELTLFDRRTSGFDASDSFTDLGEDGFGGDQLDLSIDLGLGKVEVRRAAS